MIGKALGDHGATVVRVESETRPDPLRLLPPYKDGVPGINRSQFVAYLNTSKLGLALNLGTEEGREVARRLIDWADVVLESFAPGTMAKWGLDYATLAAERPELIMLSTCLRGQSGPESKLTGFGAQGAALAGIHSVTGWPDRLPCGPWGAYTDFINPRLGVAALSAAILHRMRTGEGQHIDLAQTEAGIRFIEPLILDYTVNGRIAAPIGTRSRYESPHGVFACADGTRYIAISVESTGQWRALVQAMDLRDFAGPNYNDVAMRRRDEDAIEAVIAAWCRPRDPFETATLLKSRAVPAAVALWPSELYEDRQLAHRGFFVTLDHVEMGPTPYDGLVTRFSATPGRLRCAAPALGQDSQFVLKDLLNLPDPDIERLVMSGAIA
jgi:benzylsuccinate CoA-transferase BbsF subunit